MGILENLQIVRSLPVGGLAVCLWVTDFVQFMELEVEEIILRSMVKAENFT